MVEHYSEQEQLVEKQNRKRRDFELQMGEILQSEKRSRELVEDFDCIAVRSREIATRFQSLNASSQEVYWIVDDIQDALNEAHCDLENHYEEVLSDKRELQRKVDESEDDYMREYLALNTEKECSCYEN